MTQYRQTVYEQYASRFKDETQSFNRARAERWGRLYRRHLRCWLPADRDAAILDAGCGSGRLLYLLKNLGYHGLRGVDVSRQQAALASQVIDDVRVENVLSYLEDRQGQFDAIFALDLIEHLTKTEVLEFLRRCAEALRPGGRLVLQTPNAASPFVSAVRYGDFSHETCFSPRLLVQLLQMSGFDRCTVKECGPVPHGTVSTLRCALWKFLRLGLLFCNLVETGATQGQVLTRVFLVAAQKSR